MHTNSDPLMLKTNVKCYSKYINYFFLQDRFCNIGTRQYKIMQDRNSRIHMELY